METKFTDRLAITAPETLRSTTETLRAEIRTLMKARSMKKYLVLETYARNTELCRHILHRMRELPELPQVSCREYRPLLMLLSLSKDTEVQNDLLHHIVEPWRKAYRTQEMLYLCEILHLTGIPQPLYNMCNEVCDYFFVERRKQFRRKSTPVMETEFQFAEKRLKPLYAAVFKMKVNVYSYRTHSVEELASLLRMSVSSFRERFHSIYRTSANRWLQEQRAEQVCRDLKYYYDRPLMEIAEKNGFDSANRFWEFCTEQMKESPSELHERLYEELCKERRKFYLGE